MPSIHCNGLPRAGSAINIGVVFVEGFKWLLVLLFALLMEKSAEGIAFHFGNEPQYLKQYVHTPFGFTPDTLLVLDRTPNWDYIAGALQMVITLLFAARYFLCLIDPLERMSGLEPAEVDAILNARKTIYLHLKMLRGFDIVIVTFIAIPEFLLLFGAATSLGSYQQWLAFLFLLVLWDTILFTFVLRYLHLIPRSMATIYKAIAWFVIGGFAIRGAWFTLVHIFRYGNTSAGFLESLNRVLTEALEEFHRRLATLNEEACRWRHRADRLAGATGAYGPWNVLDGIVLATGILGVYVHSSAAFVWPTTLGWAIVGALAAIILASLILNGVQPAVKGVGATKNLPWKAAVFLIVASTGGYYWLHQYVVRHAATDSCPLQVLLLAIILGAAGYFSYQNYRLQPELWHLHVRVLRGA